MTLLKRLALLLLGFFLTWRFCDHQTEGFSLSRIQSNLEYHPEWILSTALPEGIFDQPYQFLGAGAQTFAFVSADGSTVIKFFRHHRTRHPLAPLVPYLPKPWKSRLLQTIQKRHLKRLSDFSSYCIAFEELKEETGLLYLHLNKTDSLHTTLTLYDPIGVRHQIDLDRYEFLVQKRAIPLYEALEKWIKRNEFDLAKESLHQLAFLLKGRLGKGIFDKDPDLRTNFGLIGTTPIQYDVGRFQKMESSDPDVLLRITDKLTKWLDERSPELAHYLREEVIDKQKSSL